MEWMPYYDAISKDLSLDKEMDRRSGALLSSLLISNNGLSDVDETKVSVQRTVQGKDVYVLGAGPLLEEELDRLISMMTTIGRWGKDSTGMDVIIAADGATSVALSRGYVPQIIVTDLDGGIEDQLHCLGRGSIMFVHAHGDNIPVISRVAPFLKGPVIGTVQTEPDNEGRVFNFGGFTDGDRAAFIADHFSCSSITLLGFDLTGPAMKLRDGGRRETMDDVSYARKFRKLTWANVLLALIDIPKVRFFERPDRQF
jgi:uncharacterized Rossmann fold enzyme